jgi:sulfite reductase (NADPH) flavoprotein alpha-component
LNGYFAGVAAAGEPATSSSESLPRRPILFLYGSQTGTAEALAKKLAREAESAGYRPRIEGLERHSDIRWEEESHALIITSTYGDGDMPDNAQAFWDRLTSENPPPVSHLKFSVLALGDTNYTQFCEAGKKLDARLAELGAQRMYSRVDCDVDYEEPAKKWMAGILAILGDETSAGPVDANAEALFPPSNGYHSNGSGAKPSHDRRNPFQARLAANRILNGPGSAKETRHFEISLEGSGLSYQCGDALAVQPTNCQDFAGEILASAGLRGDEQVTAGDLQIPLRESLLGHYDLKPFLNQLPVKGTSPQDLIAGLRKLAPRLYSIASSPLAHGQSVHLTVGIVRYELHGFRRKGVASTFLADRVGFQGSLPVYLQPSAHFRLPKDSGTSIIMVGPGTGIAPFRGFLHERQHSGASGRNWLFFGDQHSASDFLYREELESFLAAGVLHRLDTAFSRDQSEKIYVQHRMIEASRDLFEWLETGAIFYVCGDASRMAKDVEKALVKIFAGHLGGQDQALDYLQRLKSEKRYLRDVY